jgi:hypothetical protein
MFFQKLSENTPLPPLKGGIEAGSAPKQRNFQTAFR